MLLSNYHSHCTFCDGRSAPGEFVKFAVSKGFRAYGFSSHAPLPFETCWNMPAADMPDYLNEVNRLREKHKGKLEIYAGLEIDYLDETYHPSIPYFNELPLDYRIGSVHFLPLSSDLKEENMVCIDGPFSNFKKAVDDHFDSDIRKLVQRYYESIAKMIEAGGIDIVGHIDKIYQNGHLYKGFSSDADWYKKPLMDCLDLIARKGVMVEINTKNQVRKGQLFPHWKHISSLKEMNIPVMVNSDCHFPDLVNDGRAEAFDFLRKAGFQTTRELIGGKWEDVPF